MVIAFVTLSVSACVVIWYRRRSHASSQPFQRQQKFGSKATAAAAAAALRRGKCGEGEERTAEGRLKRLCLTASLGEDDPTGLSEPALLFLLPAPPLLGEAGSGWLLPFCFLEGLLAAALLLCKLQPGLSQHDRLS